MDAASLDRQAARSRRAAQLRDEIGRDYAVPSDDLDRLGIEALFDLRWRLLNRMMQPSYGR